jgi:hypothetical protein
MDIESEIQELKRRVGDLEGAVNVLSGRLSQVHPELVSLTRAAERRFDGVESLIGDLMSRLDLVNTQVWSLRDDLPDLISTALSDKGGGET